MIMGLNFWIASLCTYEFLFSTVPTGPAEGLKIRGWGWKTGSYLVGIICPAVGIGLTDLPKSEGGGGGG